MMKTLWTLLILNFILIGCNFEEAGEETSGLFKNHKETSNVFTFIPPDDGLYETDEIITFTLKHPGVINVTGTPRIPFDINGVTYYANYASGSGSKTLLFKYSVQLGNVDNDGIELASASIDLNGGKLQYSNGGKAVNANTDIPIETDMSNVLVSSTTLFVASISVVDGSYKTDDIISLQLNLAETGVVTGVPQLALTIDGQTKYATYQSGSNSTTLVFNYQVESGLEDLDGIDLPASLDLTGASLKSVGGEDFTAQLPSDTNTSAVLVNSMGPRVVSITAPADDLYVENDILDFTVQFDEVAHVTGVPQLNIDLEFGGPVTADYFSGTGTNTWIFRYTIIGAAGDTDGIELVSPLSLNSGSIDDTEGNTSTDLSFTPPNTTGVQIDPPQPVVTLDAPANIRVANVNTYSLSGTCSHNGEDVVINIGSHTVTPNPVCSSTSWSVSNYDISSISDAASVTITVDQSSGGLDAVQVSDTVIKDTVAPVLTFTVAENINLSNVTSYTIEGTCLDPDDHGTGVSILAGGSKSINTTCNNGLWSTTGNDMSATADSDNYEIKANMTDGVGNPAAEITVTIIKDTVAPGVAITSPSDNSYINIANDSATFPFSGTCDVNGATVVIKVDGVNASSQAGFNCDGSNFSGTIDSTVLAEDSFVFTAFIEDDGGNAKTSDPINIIRDVTAPVVAITVSSDITLANVTSYTVQGTCLDPEDEGGTATVLLGGTQSEDVTCLSGAWTTGSIDVSGTADNINYAITVNMTDAAGNSATEDAVSIIKDTVAPGVQITSPSDNSYINIANESATFTINGTCDQNGLTVNILVDGVDAVSQSGFVCDGSNFSGTIDSTGITEDSHVFTAYIEDENGNNSTSDPVNFIKDITAPVLTFTSSDPIALNNHTNYSVSGTCLSPDDEGISVNILIDGSVAKSATCSSGVWTASAIDASSIGDNLAVNMTANMTDAAGNPATEIDQDVVKDTVPPAIALITPADSTYINIASDSTTFTVNGTCDENGALVNIQIDGVDAASQSGFTCDGTNFSGTVDTTGYAEAVLTFTAVIEDSYANQATTAGNDVTRDVTRPNVDSVARSDARLLNGQNLDIDVYFDEAVNISGNVGINVDIETNTRSVAYNSGSGSSSTVFRYALTDSDYDLTAIEFNSSSVSLNAGSISDLAGNSINSLSFAAINSTVYVLPDSVVTWFDANDNSTVFTDTGCSNQASTGQTVKCWENKYDGTSNATTNSGPTYSANQLNGNPVMTFSGQQFSNAVNFDAKTVFLVFRGQDQAQEVWGDFGGDLGVEFERSSFIGIVTRRYVFNGSCGNNCKVKWAHNDDGESGYVAEDTSWLNNQWARLFMESESATGVNMQTHQIGSGDFDGAIAEIIIFNETLTANQKAAVHAYLNAKHGL